MNELSLTGLDGANPLAYFAALGLLRVLDDHARRRRAAAPRLSFRDEGRLVPCITTDLSIDDVISVVLEDAASQADNPVLRIAYDSDGQERPPHHPGASHDLKPPPALARAVLERVVTASPRAVRLAAALFTELVQDNKGNTKPTAFHFTAGQQAFLAMVEDLRSQISTDDVREALVGPWTNSSKLPSLSWDASVTRLYALRAGDPSKERRGSVPAANWLGFVGLEFFPVQAIKGRLVTTCVEGGWKDSCFTWPLWDPALTTGTIASLLRCDVAALDARERRAMGIVAVLRSRILRSDQGGYGTFTPADVVVPASAHSRSA